MNIKTGVDLVYIPRFRKTLKSGGATFLQRVYLPEELRDKRLTRLAGIFAAKEAVMKALSLPLDSWHAIQITHRKNGAPEVKIENYKLRIENSSLTISHDGNYVIAYFVALGKG